jgi:anti-anti-sigma factor
MTAVHGTAAWSGPAAVARHYHPVATVITISGEVDAHNAAEVGDCAQRLIGADRTVVIDMTGVKFLAVDGLLQLLALKKVCRSACVNWMIATSDAVNRLMVAAQCQGEFAAVESVSEALARFRHPSSQRPALQIAASADWP